MGRKIGIIGSGLSGLACALESIRLGHEPLIFEKSAQAGGRVRTETQDGFLLDLGFQVYLPSYPAGREVFNLNELKLRSFSPGAHIWFGERFVTISDPRRDPGSLFETLLSPVATFSDKLLTLKFIYSSHEGLTEFSRSMPTAEYLTQFGFSERYIHSFLKPFFSGVFLDPDLNVPHPYFIYLFQKFSESSAALPERGMGALTAQLCQNIGSSRILLNSDVKTISPNEIKLTDGSVYPFDSIVVATDAADLHGLLGESAPSSRDFNSVTTHYYKTHSNRFFSDKLYVIPGGGIVNHVACLSAVASSYAPPGWQLFSVNTLQNERDCGEENPAVRAHLRELFGADEIQDWAWIRSFPVSKALPRFPSYGQKEILSNGVFVCGDHMESPSIQGALSSGLKVARAINALS